MTKKSQENLAEQKGRNLKANIEMRQKKMKINNNEMAKLLGLNPLTYRQKVLHPHRFTYIELIMVFTVLKFSQEELVESI